MTSRDRNVVIAVLAAVVLGGFWFMVLSPKRKTSADLDKQITVQQQRLTTARASVDQAQAAKASYKTDYAAVAKLGQAVPADDDVPSLVYQVDHAAKAAKIDFRSLKASQSQGAAPAPAAAAAPVAPAATAAAGTAGTTPAAVPVTVDPSTFPTLPFALVFNGSFFRLEDFLHSLDGFTRVDDKLVDVHGRLLQIKGVTLGPGKGGFPRMTATVEATAYVLPADQGLTAGATPQGPAAAPVPAGTAPASAPAAPTTAATAALTTGGSR